MRQTTYARPNGCGCTRAWDTAQLGRLQPDPAARASGRGVSTAVVCKNQGVGRFPTPLSIVACFSTGTELHPNAYTSVG